MTNLPNSSLSTQRWVRFPEPSSAAVWRGGPHRSRGLRCAHRGGNLRPRRAAAKGFDPVRFVVCPKKKKQHLQLKFYSNKRQTHQEQLEGFFGGMAVADGVLSTVKNPQIWTRSRFNFNYFQPRSLDRRSPRGREKLGRPPPWDPRRSQGKHLVKNKTGNGNGTIVPSRKEGFNEIMNLNLSCKTWICHISIESLIITILSCYMIYTSGKKMSSGLMLATFVVP